MKNKPLSIAIIAMVSVASISGFIFLVMEAVLPEVQINSPYATAYDNEPIPVNISVTNQNVLKNVWYNWNGTDAPYTGVTYVLFPIGYHTLSAYARDIMGNVGITQICFTIVSGNNFSAVWNTSKITGSSSFANQIRLPLHSLGTYQFQVDWNDGTQGVITAFDQPEVVHTYTTPGEYTINITGTIKGWKFAPNPGGGDRRGDRLKLVEIKHWGDLGIEDYDNYYFCENLVITADDAPDLNGTQNLRYTFAGCSSIETIPRLNEWNVSGVINMEGLFYGANKFNQSLTEWDVSKVETMGYMFYNAYKFNQSIAEWDVSSVSDMTSMFFGTIISTENYDSLLIAWSQLSLQSGVNFHAGSSQYSAGAAASARGVLTETYGWIITDGGQV